MKNFLANWKIWIPKIYQKVKLEAGLHRKTYLSFLPLISEYADKSAEGICEGKHAVQIIMCYDFAVIFRSRRFIALTLLAKTIKQ